MKKKLIFIILLSLLQTSMAFAQDSQRVQKITKNGVDIYLDKHSINQNAYDEGKLDWLLKQAKEQFQNKPSSRSSAPGVKKVDIVLVASTQGGREQVLGKSVTSFDHGGREFFVDTLVQGYGGNSYDRAQFAGNTVTQISSDGWDLDRDGIIDSWYDRWDLSNFSNQDGEFIVWADSINPGPTLSARIQIR